MALELLLGVRGLDDVQLSAVRDSSQMIEVLQRVCRRVKPLVSLFSYADASEDYTQYCISTGGLGSFPTPSSAFPLMMKVFKK